MATNVPMPNVDPIEAQIHETFDRLVSCLNERRNELITRYREIQARPADRTRMERELLDLKAETEQRIRMNLLRETQLEILAKLEQKLEEVRAPLPDTRVKFLSDTIRLEREIAGVGEIIEEEVPVVPRYDRMRCVVAVGKKGTAPGELYFPRGIAIDENTGYIYVTEVFGSRVSVFSETGDFLNTFSHQDMRFPWGIALHRDNIYVTDLTSDSVFHFKMEQQIRHVATFGSGKGSSNKRLNNPRGLTVSTEGDVFVTDRNNHRIKILDQSLRFKRHVTHQSMKNPQDVKLTRDEMYVLCDSSPCVLVLSHAGEMTRSLVTRGDGMQVYNPLYFCLDAEQNLLISDCGAHDVKIFSKDGTYLHAVGQESHERGMLYQPMGIALTKDLNLVIVSENNNFGLQIFSCK